MPCGTVVGGAVRGAVMVALGDVPRQSHVTARDLQQLAALRRVAQPLGRPKGSLGIRWYFSRAGTGRLGTLCRI